MDFMLIIINITQETILCYIEDLVGNRYKKLLRLKAQKEGNFE